MKKLILIPVILIQLLFACSNDKSLDNSVTTVVEYDELNSLADEYNINQDGLYVESYTTGIDTTQLFFNGRMNNRLWVGCYDKKTKTKLAEWTEATNLDTLLCLNTGNGTDADFKIVRFFIEYPYYHQNKMEFLLWGYNDEAITTSGRIISSDLYFVSNDSLVNKKRSFTYPSETRFYQNIVPWHNSLFSEYNHRYICYSSEGDSLYSVANPVGANDEAFSTDESIYFTSYHPTDETITFDFRRYNLKNDQFVWQNSVSDQLAFDSKLDSTILNKSAAVWYYSFYYTAMDSDSTRFKLKVGLNINSGKLRIID